MDVLGNIHGVPGLFVASLFSGALRYVTWRRSTSVNIQIKKREHGENTKYTTDKPPNSTKPRQRSMIGVNRTLKKTTEHSQTHETNIYLGKMGVTPWNGKR